MGLVPTQKAVMGTFINGRNAIDDFLQFATNNGGTVFGWIDSTGVSRGTLSPVAGLWNVISKTSTYAAVAGDVVLANTTGGGFTITLPASGSNKNLSIRVKKISSDSNVVTVSRSGSDLIDGQTTQTFTSQWTNIEIIADGVTNWYVV